MFRGRGRVQRCGAILRDSDVTPIKILGADCLYWWTGTSGFSAGHWVDKVAGLDLVQTNPSAQPVVASAWGNGHAGVRFRGSDYLSADLPTNIATADVFIAFQVDGIYGCVLDLSVDRVTNSGAQMWQYEAGKFFIRRMDNDWFRGEGLFYPFALSTRCRMMGRFSNTLGHIQVNGISGVDATATVAIGSCNRIDVGRFCYNAWYLDGVIGDIVIANYGTPEDKITKLDEYFKSYWGLT